MQNDTILAAHVNGSAVGGKVDRSIAAARVSISVGVARGQTTATNKMLQRRQSVTFFSK